jgi:tRNA threonylcarbamoyladenosine biosynthesis protein TsaB
MSAGLAITGSQRSVGVAAWREGAPVAVVDLHDPPRDRDWLWPSIDAVCRDAGVRPAGLGWIAVDIGPGGFSGLRTTIAAAQSIATVQGVPCVPVPSALVAAHSTTMDIAPARAHAVLAVKGTTAWIATLERDEAGWIQVDASVIECTEWKPSPGSCVLADGHCPEVVRDACIERGVRLIEPIWTGSGVMAAARRLWAGGLRVHASALEAEYAREPEAVTLWRQRHGG